MWGTPYLLLSIKKSLENVIEGFPFNHSLGFSQLIFVYDYFCIRDLRYPWSDRGLFQKLVSCTFS